jgi:hypothetical protein
VSREVVFVLLLVVFESHPVTQTEEDTTVYIHMSIQRFGAIGIRTPIPRAVNLDSQVWGGCRERLAWDRKLGNSASIEPSYPFLGHSPR